MTVASVIPGGPGGSPSPADAGAGAGGGAWWMWAAAAALGLAALALLVWSYLDRPPGDERGPRPLPPRAAAGGPAVPLAAVEADVPTTRSGPPPPRPRPAVPHAAAEPARAGPGPVPATPPAPVAHAEGGSERQHLVMLCIDVADRLRDENPALEARLHRGLAEIGVVAVEPDGEPFDRGRHDAVASERADAAEQDRVVARTERLGYRDRGGLVRRPEVVVYAWEGP